MHIDKQDVGGIRKLFQDLVAPEISSVKATLSIMREEAKAAESRSEQNFALIREEMKAAEARSDKNFEAAEARSDQNFKAAEARSDKNFEAAEARSEQNFKAAEARSDKNFALIREEMRAAETRAEQNFSLLRAETQNMRADLMDRIERSRREVLLAIENQALKQENAQLKSAAKRDQPSA